MKLSRSVFLVLIATSIALAQTQTPPQDWIPQGIESLGQNASSRTEFTLDHSMLVLASKMDQDDEDLRRVIAGVDGVSVHSFRFKTPAMYDPELLGSVRQQYHAAGWKHMVSTHEWWFRGNRSVDPLREQRHQKHRRSLRRTDSAQLYRGLRIDKSD